MSAVSGIARRAPVPEPDPEFSVGAERELAAVVIRERLIDGEQGHGRGRVGDVGVDRYRKANDLGIPAHVGEVDVEEAVRLVVGMEHETQEPLLASRGDQGGQIEKRSGEELGTVEDENRAPLLDEEETAAAISRMGHNDGPVQSLDYRSKIHGSGGGQAPGPENCRGEHDVMRVE